MILFAPSMLRPTIVKIMNDGIALIEPYRNEGKGIHEKKFP